MNIHALLALELNEQATGRIAGQSQRPGDATASFTRIARHVTLLNYRSLDLSFAMNLLRYQMLVPSFQAALEDAALTAGQYCAELLDSTSQQIDRLLEEDNAVVHRVAVRPWQQQSKKIISSLEQEGYWKAGLFDVISAIRVA
ncbi:TRAP-type C4-dicarboxylate transport system substrate-binding protein [Bradyrhizobium sp. JR1.5]|uniref:hypothetical protein n=1 Tax=unclassified Bradyrhizobium TaxID=2631580 RepID=UPI003391E2FD